MKNWSHRCRLGERGFREIYTLLSTSPSYQFAAEISLGSCVNLLDEDVHFNKTNSGHFVMNGNRRSLACSCLISMSDAEWFQLLPFLRRISVYGVDRRETILGRLVSSREDGNACHVFLLCVQNLVEKHDLDLVRAKGLYCDPKCLE